MSAQCSDRRPGTKEQCEKPADHGDFHWRVSPNGVQVWDAFRGRR